MENLVWLVSEGTKCKISAAGMEFCKNPENQLERTKGWWKQFYWIYSQVWRPTSLKPPVSATAIAYEPSSFQNELPLLPDLGFNPSSPSPDTYVQVNALTFGVHHINIVPKNITIKFNTVTKYSNHPHCYYQQMPDPIWTWIWIIMIIMTYRCQTPSGSAGNCVSLRSCPTLLRLLRQGIVIVIVIVIMINN